MLKTDLDFKKFNNLKRNLLKIYIYRSKNVSTYYCCPFCNSIHFIRYGKYNGIQRYICKECKKTFSNTTNSAWKYLKKEPEKWIQFIELTLEGKTLKRCSEILSMSITTAFYWRHKFFHAIEKTYKIKALENSAEICVYMTNKCYKGSRNKHYTVEEKESNRITRRYRLPHGIDVLMVKEDKKICFVRRTEPSESNSENFENNILNIADKNCYMKLYRTNRWDLTQSIKHFNAKVNKKIRKKYESKSNINSECRNFIAFLNMWKKKFRGIATKYINHYYNFFSLVYAEEEFDYIDLFSEILKNGLYISINNMRLTHAENY
ncbi:transposase [Clostridium sp. BJN0001]|uniref:IS1/IS1595 family N-terminal zinc-binding domain-containing protein n=1 Tax=Clostridium sp. BJN0001 TaxID=2930219 RepID=UPI001FD49AF8|nr:transposase [Clostridium sp. BJN0001]